MPRTAASASPNGKPKPPAPGYWVQLQAGAFGLLLDGDWTIRRRAAEIVTRAQSAPGLLPQTTQGADYASALIEFLMLGNVATQFEETFEFDPIAMKIVNHAEADGLLSCAYRPGWTL